MIVLQEGCKCLLYVVLHARVVLDLWERPQSKIAFQLVEGDFESFSGSWTLEQLGSEHTLLKYAVDAKMHKDSRLAEAIVEEVMLDCGILRGVPGVCAANCCCEELTIVDCPGRC